MYTDPPEAQTTENTQIEAIFGEDLILTINYDGNPTPKVTWLLDGIDVVLNDYNRSVTVTARNGTLYTTLMINSLNTHNGGLYSCNLTNSVGELLINVTEVTFSTLCKFDNYNQLNSYILYFLSDKHPLPVH